MNFLVNIIVISQFLIPKVYKNCQQLYNFIIFTSGFYFLRKNLFNLRETLREDLFLKDLKNHTRELKKTDL